MITVVNAKRRGRPPAFERSVAMEHAMQVFWSAGYNGSSIPMLTNAMGISAQSLYAAFGSKHALYREAMELYRSTIGGFGAKALDEEPDAVAAVVRLLRDSALTFSRTEGTPGCMIVSAPGDSGTVELTELGRTLRAERIVRIALRLEEGIRDGQIRAGVDVPVWSRYVATVVQGMSIQARDGATREALLSVAQAAAQPILTLRQSCSSGSSSPKIVAT